MSCSLTRFIDVYVAVDEAGHEDQASGVDDGRILETWKSPGFESKYKRNFLFQNMLYHYCESFFPQKYFLHQM